MKYKIILLISFLSINSHFTFSQIKGYVMDKQGVALPYVNIVLQKMQDSTFVEGTTTDNNGYFCLEKYNPTPLWLIQLSAIGYSTLTYPTDKLPDKIILKDEVTQLGEVTVKASRPVYKMKGTNLLVNVQNSIMKDLGTANDVIERLPGVKGSDGSFQIFGKGAAVIYINGRKVEDSKELDRLNANNMETVEIIKNPGVEYDASTKAVIRIKLKKNENEGFSGTVTLRGNQGRKFSDSEYSQLAYNTTHVNAFISIGNYSTRIRTDQRNKDLTYANNTQWNMHTDMMDWDNHYYTQNLMGGLSYSANKNHVLGGSLSFTNNSDRYKGPSATEMRKGNTLYENLKANSSTRNDYKQWIGNVYYDGKWSKWNINFNGDYVRRTSNGNEENLEEGNLTPAHLVQNLSDATYNIYAGRLKSSYHLSSDMSLSFGLDGSHVKENKANTEYNDGNTNSSLHSEETKYAAFANYTWNYKKLSLQIGIRYEELKIKYKDELTQKDLVSKNNGRFYPSASLSLPVGQTEMAFSYTSKVRRPTFYQLRNSTEYSNRYSSAQGNPYLLPQYTSDLSYSLQYKDWQFDIAYQYVEDYLSTQVIIESDDPLNRISKPVNINHCHALQAGILYHPVIGLWKPQVSLNIMRTYLDLYNEDGSKIDNTLPYLTCSFTNSFQFPHQWNVFADIYYTGDGHLREYRIKPYTYANIGVSKYLLGKSLLLSLSIYDLFRSCKETEIRYSSNNTFEKWRYRDSRQIRLMVRYNLYNNKKKYYGKTVAADEINRL